MSYLINTLQRYRTVITHKIYSLPVVILMPHSACNCRCIMCDIWQDNKNLKQLTEDDLNKLLSALRQYRTSLVVMSGGEALLNKNFFKLCEILRRENIKISLLSTGLSLKQHAENIVTHINDVIVSLDGSELVHDQIRRIPNAFQKLREGVAHLKSLKPNLRVTGRTVIQLQNFRDWPMIIETAKKIGLDQISFLPADISSTAFNRENLWDNERKEQVRPAEHELPEFEQIIEKIISDYSLDFRSGFIAESADKLRKIYLHYSASYALNEYPYKKCNAPWVSAVIEADGTVRHCFFLESTGNIRNNNLQDILNSEVAIQFRKNLDTHTNDTCAKCVCYLNLPPNTRL